MNPNEKMEYISDEALFALIETTEDQGLLTAPRELKGAILAEAEHLPQIRSKPSRQKQFTAYCFRVGLATAASLVLLFGSGQMTNNIPKLPSQEPTISQRFNQFTDDLEQGFLTISRQISQFDFNFGGNDHE